MKERGVFMETKEKKQSLGTILLLVVGSIFIAVAACIFVYKAWGYMTEDMKKLLIVVAATLFFGLSYLAEKKIHVKGSASAFYYLGTILTGLSAAVLADPEILEKLLPISYRQADELCTLATITAMLIPMAIRLVQKKTAWDLIMTVLLAEGSIGVWLSFFEAEYSVVSLTALFVQAILLFLYDRVKQHEEEKSLRIGMKILCMIQAVFYFTGIVFVNMFMAWFSDGFEEAAGLLVLTMSFVSMYLYYVRDKKIPALVNVIADLLCLVIGFAGAEMNVIPKQILFEKGILIAAIGVWLLGRIFRVKNIDVKVVQFVLNCLLMAALLWHNIEDGELVNVLILGASALGMLLVAVWKNHKGYIILGAVTLILLVLYVTRRFWLSVSWWIYLLIAGVVMITIAVYRERRNK